MRSSKLFYLFLVTTLASIANHAYLAFNYYDVKLGLSGTVSFCNINSTFNCDAVTASNYSNVNGIPVALFGMLAHIVLLLFGLVAQWNLSSRRGLLEKTLLLLAGLIALTSLIMGSISTVIVASFCLFCLLAYALSFLNLFIVWRWQSEPVAEGWLASGLEILQSQKWILGFLAAIPAAAWVGNKMFLDSYGFKDLDRMILENKYSWQAAPVQNFDLKTGLVHAASLPAKMTIVEFADFRCSHCKTAAPVLHSFIQSRKDVHFVFKSFPLDGSCNPELESRSGDGSSCVLAAASLCAENLAQKGFIAHDWIFENQSKFMSGVNREELLKNLSALTGIESESYKSCLESEATTQSIRAMATEGGAAKIKGTPSIFVNGKKLDGGQFMPILEAVYRSL
jgi:protein-disulfide isomerase